MRRNISLDSVMDVFTFILLLYYLLSDIVNLGPVNKGCILAFAPKCNLYLQALKGGDAIYYLNFAIMLLAEK
jgi:hypothetical protein